jgi:hypothetical protein
VEARTEFRVGKEGRSARLSFGTGRGHAALRVEAGQHAQARAENTFSHYERLFGGRLRARGEMAQRNEAPTACNILNRMSALGMPRSERIATA